MTTEITQSPVQGASDPEDPAPDAPANTASAGPLSPPVPADQQPPAPADQQPPVPADQQPPAPAAQPPTAAAGRPSALIFRSLPDSRHVAPGWWLLTAVAVGLAAWLTVVVARGTHFTTGHRTAAAWTALLVVAALALVAQVILLWYQSRLPDVPGAAADQPTLAYRRRGLKAAVMGQDGRASTSKTQVVLWTAAVLWALVDLLLLARAYHGTTLFTNAVTSNWHPEYLVLLGLPVAAATAAKAAVAGANSGQGPATAGTINDVAAAIKDIAASPGVSRVYVRNPVREGVWGLLAGVAELFTGDDDTVAWADLQYVVFTLITLAYFASQFLAQPTAGLPPVPAALLTLMGVSATGYAANKIVSTKVNTKQPPAA